MADNQEGAAPVLHNNLPENLQELIDKAVEQRVSQELEGPLNKLTQAVDKHAEATVPTELLKAQRTVELHNELRPVLDALSQAYIAIEDPRSRAQANPALKAGERNAEALCIVNLLLKGLQDGTLPAGQAEIDLARAKELLEAALRVNTTVLASARGIEVYGGKPGGAANFNMLGHMLSNLVPTAAKLTSQLSPSWASHDWTTPCAKAAEAALKACNLAAGPKGAGSSGAGGSKVGKGGGAGRYNSGSNSGYKGYGDTGGGHKQDTKYRERSRSPIRRKQY
jgi:hypothetical protein